MGVWQEMSGFGEALLQIEFGSKRGCFKHREGLLLPPIFDQTTQTPLIIRFIKWLRNNLLYPTVLIN